MMQTVMLTTTLNIVMNLNIYFGTNTKESSDISCLMELFILKNEKMINWWNSYKKQGR